MNPGDREPPAPNPADRALPPVGYGQFGVGLADGRYREEVS